jgi:multidrug efflux pump subunit AcrA (membrane-fusion protein)
LLWLPFWKLLSRHRLTRRARYASRWKWALGIVTVVGLLLAIVPARFTVEGQAVLQPASQRNVFAALDGEVNAVYVEHGDLVKAGDVIAELRNTDLDVRIAEVLGQRRAAQEQLATTQRMRHDTKLAAEERDRLSGQVQQVEEQLRGLEEQYKLLTAKREQLVVRSPIAGRVITWNVRRQLLHRPVVTGQTLVTIADVTGPWELEVYLPESRLGHLAAARDEHDHSLSVEYLLAADPTVRRQGTVRAVDASAQLHEPYGHGVRVLVDLDSSELERPKSGATATARIDCGQRSLGYVWLHGAIEFFQAHVLFKLS